VTVSVTYTGLGRPHGYASESWLGSAEAGAVAALLRRLGRAPASVHARQMKLGDVALVTARPGEPRLPLAFIHQGLTAPQLSAELERLTKESLR
jgi:hypothetical protein